LSAGGITISLVKRTVRFLNPQTLCWCGFPDLFFLYKKIKIFLKSVDKIIISCYNKRVIKSDATHQKEEIMENLKVPERMEAVREFALNAINLPGDAIEVKPNVYAIKTPNGYAKVTVTAVKELDYDPVVENEALVAHRAEVEAKRIERERAKAEKLANKGK